MNYTLNLIFTPEQINLIYETNMNVIIAKPVTDEKPELAWQTFRPMESNRLEWQDQYGIYASTIVPGENVDITKTTTLPIGAARNALYTLGRDGVISGPGKSTGGSNSFSVLNQFQNGSSVSFMTIGLTQDATVNGMTISANPLSAARVPYQNTAEMTPDTGIYISLQSQAPRNMLAKVTSQMTRLVFRNGATEISATYNSDAGMFIQSN
ncbi:hypothetical protein [Taibaiella soli]|uniref:Uncharacterized protein n=1 Tax=Taibaiella soli TaxID=1649169 RepID=A0A2W2AZ29_9BACT|nr:hypothetical protein [Taibaiella soli]PZF73274.1 hypothetical protein DN068_08875 [Taibaiella soli]